MSRSLQKNKNKFDINSDTVAIVEKMELVSIEDAKIVVKDENGEYKPKNPEDLAINLSAVVVAQNKAKIVTLGQLCAYASTKFTDFSKLEDKTSGTKETLAKGILKGEGGETKTA